MSEEQLEAALDLTRRLPPAEIEDNLFFLLDLAPDLTESLLSTVDQPLKTETDDKAGRDFLLCDYNRDGDSFRSPWTNEYFPPIDDGAIPSDALRAAEIQANKVFDRYRDVYYGAGSISSVYLWETDEDNSASSNLPSAWAACVLVFKEGASGSWNSINVVEVVDKGAVKPGSFEYKLTTTVMLTLKGEGGVDLSGSLTRQRVDTSANPKGDINVHIKNMGEMIEEMEGRLRSAVDVVYFGKTQEVLSYLRVIGGTKAAKDREEAQRRVISEMAKAAAS